jgi:tRNA dimethylallyltransferase
MNNTPIQFPKNKEAKTCIIICGPTAVGKTGFAIQLAQYLNTQIISADSRQCFKELNIGVAKPSYAQLQAVRHSFINSHSVNEDVNVATFESYALDQVEKIFAKNDFAVMVGGTGLYISAFCQGIDKIPEVPEEIRNEIIFNFNKFGKEWLRQQSQKNDINFYTRGEIDNPQRLMRALEVKLHTGKSIISFQSQQKKERGFKIIKVGLELPRELLYNRIHTRVDSMIKEGLEEEVRSLLEFKDLNALKTVGYTEFFKYFEETGQNPVSRLTHENTIDRIKQSSRNYAKRQLTWFKKDPEIKWVDAAKGLSASLVSEISWAI